MIRKFALAAAAAAAVVVSGCSSVSVDRNGYDLSKIDPYIDVNKTTLKDVREYLGTPTFTAVTQKGGSKVVGYSFIGHNTGAVLSREVGRGMLSFGIAPSKWEATVKVAVFKFDKKGVVTGYRKGGSSFLYRSRLKTWNECERRLTDQEINSPAVYSDKQICEIYAKEIAAKEGISASKVDLGKEFEGCDAACMAVRVGKEAFGNLKDVKDVVSAEEGDGSKFVFAK